MLLFVYIVDGIANVFYNNTPIVSSVRFSPDIQPYALSICSRRLEIVEVIKWIVVCRVVCCFIQICGIIKHDVYVFLFIGTYTASSGHCIRIQMLVSFLVKSDFYIVSIR